MSNHTWFLFRNASYFNCYLSVRSQWYYHTYNTEIKERCERDSWYSLTQVILVKHWVQNPEIESSTYTNSFLRSNRRNRTVYLKDQVNGCDVDEMIYLYAMKNRNLDQVIRFTIKNWLLHEVLWPPACGYKLWIIHNYLITTH